MIFYACFCFYSYFSSFLDTKQITNAYTVNITAPANKKGIRRRRSIDEVKNSTAYWFLLVTPGCRRFDSKTKKWSGAGCKVLTTKYSFYIFLNFCKNLKLIFFGCNLI